MTCLILDIGLLDPTGNLPELYFRKTAIVWQDQSLFQRHSLVIYAFLGAYPKEFPFMVIFVTDAALHKTAFIENALYPSEIFPVYVCFSQDPLSQRDLRKSINSF